MDVYIINCGSRILYNSYREIVDLERGGIVMHLYINLYFAFDYKLQLAEDKNMYLWRSLMYITLINWYV
jgi:hypothetical protein